MAKKPKNPLEEHAEKYGDMTPDEIAAREADEREREKKKREANEKATGAKS
jgi:hypothetical protein